jgi:hypothetical protein
LKLKVVFFLAKNLYFILATASFSPFPALNFTTLLSGISTFFPVSGTLASLALLLIVVKEPKPIKFRLSPFANVL